MEIELTSDDASLVPTAVPPGGIKVCRCNVDTLCLDEIPPPAAGLPTMSDSEIRVCIFGGSADDPIDVSFYQITQEGVDGPTHVIVPYGGADADGTGVHPDATYEPLPNGQGVAISVPLDGEYFDLEEEGQSYEVSGMVIVGDSEESFQLVVDLSGKDPADEADLILSNTKELHGESARPRECFRL